MHQVAPRMSSYALRSSWKARLKPPTLARLAHVAEGYLPLTSRTQLWGLALISSDSEAISRACTVRAQKTICPQERSRWK